MTKVFLICSGLGRVNRGYESFTRECFAALRGAPELDLTLFKGGGTAAEKEVVLWNLPRSHAFSLWFSQQTGRTSYLVEQLTFGLSLLPHIWRQQPDVVYFSDISLGKMLLHWRRLTRRKFTLLFRNGGPMKLPYPPWDFVQQLVPVHMEEALAAGENAGKQGLVSPGIFMASELCLPSPAERASLRRSLNLPLDRPVMLSVGLLDKSYKRMDYVIRETAALSEPRPFLALLGQEDAETPEVRELAEMLLGSGNFQIRTVSAAFVASYYQVADVFVLATLMEGFGRVYVEALSWGLPCLAHDSALTRSVLGQEGLLADFEQPGSLAALLPQALSEGSDGAVRERRHREAFRRFSWQELRPQYIAMLRRCAALSPCVVCFHFSNWFGAFTDSFSSI